MQNRIGLSWTIRSTFRDYVLALPDGVAESGRGAAEDDGRYWFPAAPEHRGEQRGLTSFAFDGEVRFGGHHGMLLVAIARPGVDVGPDGSGAVMIDYPWFAHRPMPRVCIASGDAHAGEGRDDLRLTRVRLTKTGSDLFGGAYDVGDPLDDLELIGVGPASALLARS